MPEYSQTLIEFTPQADITAYELAQCIRLIRVIFSNQLIEMAYFDSLSIDITRHFTATLLNPPDEGGGGEG